MKYSKSRWSSLWDELQDLEMKVGGAIAVTFAVSLLTVIGIPTARDVLRFWGEIEQEERAQVGIIVLQTVVTAIGGIAIFWNIVLARRQMMIAQKQSETLQDQMRIAQNQIITELFSRAIEQLGHPQSSVRIGAIYSLERIARDSSQDHCSVIEVIASYVRDRCVISSKTPLESKTESGKDIDAAIAVLGKLNARSGTSLVLNLKCSDLRGVDFDFGNFSKADLFRSQLSNGNFYETVLCQAKLEQTDLTAAKLRRADLRGANLTKANLSLTDLRECDLMQANLDRANFTGAWGLTVEQVQSTLNWQTATFDEELAAQLCHSPDS